MPPSVNHNPYGDLTAVEGGTGAIHVVGWVADPDDPNAHPYVDIYVGGPAGSGAEGYRIQANLDSIIDGAHTYDAWINVSRTGNQPVYAYGINVGEGDDNPELWNCPKYAYINADAEAPTISNVQVSNLTPDGYDVSCDVSDNMGVACVRFPTWTSHSTNGNTQDDIRWDEQAHGNGHYTYHVNVNDHNGEQGVLYHTHIYAYDGAGNVTNVGPSINIPVPHAMVNYSGNTYLRMDADVSDLQSWQHAEERCQGSYFSGHLATITSSGEQQAIDGLLSATSTSMVHWWIGATDASSEGAWAWLTGEEFAYSHWRSIEPNGGTRENFAGVRSDGGYWDDLNGNANTSTGYIMELDGYHRLYGEVATDIEEGIYTINSFDHPEFAVDVAWMSDASGANVQLCTDNGTDAQRFQFTKNYVDSPDGPVHDGTYTITNVHSGMALDVANASLVTGGNVWQYPANGTNAQKWYIERGPDGSVYLRSKISDFYLDVYGAYFESGTNIQVWNANDSAAQRFTLKKSANPKAISSRVYDITPNGYKVQVKLDAPRGIQFVEFPTWTQSKQADITWGRGDVDGNTVTYEVKVSDHGNRHGIYWTHVYVTDNYGSRCWVDAEQNDVIVPEAVSSVGNKTYYLVPANMSWDDAKNACVKFGGLIGCDAHLATVKTAEEQSLLADLVSGGERVEYWLGASDANEEGTWRWVDDTSLDGYTSWAVGEPNGGTEENYLGMNRADGLWNDEYANAYATKGVGFVAEVVGDDRCAPTISDVLVTDLDQTGYTVSCKVADPSGIAKVEFPTWVPERGETSENALWKDGDLYEDPATGAVIAEFRVSTSDHADAKGRYETHIYATDKAGNKTRVYAEADKNGKVENILVPDAVYNTQNATYYRFDHAGKWTDAKTCVEAMPLENMQLATVENGADNDALASLLSGAGKSAYWLGLSDAEGDGSFAWPDGDVPTYTHWADGQPGTYTGARYGAVLVLNAKWYGYANDGVNSNSNLMGFVAMVGYSEESLCPDGHTWGEWKTAVEPTCAKDGYRTRSCEVCGEAEVERIATLAHDPLEAQRQNEVAATCEDDGSYESVVICSRCGGEIGRQTVKVDKLGHSPADPVEENRTEPTCTAKGSYESVTYCSRCGKELGREAKELPVAEHTPSDPVEENRTEPTCTAEGGYDSVTYCQVCGTEVERTHVTISKAEHAWDGGAVTKSPTCTKTGERTFTCAKCGETRVEDVAATGHVPGQPVTENASASNNCEVGGTYDEVVYCSVCHEELSRTQRTQPAGQHVTVVDPAVAPTCTKGGLTEGSHCLVCGSVIVAQELVAATGHTRENVDAVAPTCADPGTTAGVRCKTCGEVLEGCEPIAALNHDYHEAVVEPTCAQFGYTEHKCSRCGDTYVTDRVAAKAHTAGEPAVESETPATCEAQGSKVLLTRCKDCGKELYRTTEATPATGHTADEPQVESETAATCEAAGRKETVTHCKDCGHEMARTVEVTPATGHTAGNPSVESEVAATCEQPGSRVMVTKCSACNKEMSRTTETVPATGHEWDQGTVTKAATCTDLGEKTFSCGKCGVTRKESIPSGSHKPGNATRENEDAATCGHAGHYESVTRCEECSTELSRQTVTTDALDHDWGEWEVAREATVAREGLEIKTCSRCGMSTTRDIPKLEPMSIETAILSAIPDQAYTGGVVTPRPEVRLDGATLREGVDYTLSYLSNVSPGTATVIVHGTGNYTGAKSATFRIVVPNAPVVRDGVDWSPVYDPTYYAAQNPDVANWARRSDGTIDGSKLLQHFVNNGAREGRRSKAGFELASYYNANADLRRAFGTDWARYYRHYCTNGRGENRACSGVGSLRGSLASRDGVDWSPVYDGVYYAAQNGDVARWATRTFASGSVLDDAALLQHFVGNGSKEGRRSKAGFELASYYNANSDLRRAFGTDWARYYRHFCTNGQRERRACSNVGSLRGALTSRDGVDWSPTYDASEYARRNADVARWATRSFNSGSVLDDAALLQHFVNNGQRERRQAKSTFNVTNYRNRYADLNRAFGDDWPRYYRHFATNGFRENRNGA